MTKKIFFHILVYSCLSFLLNPVTGLANQTDFVDDSVKDILTVVSAGAAGAVLGLSTLSFVETPKDHLKNIVVGGALGIIVGVGVVAYNQANVSRDYYERHALTEDFSTLQRVSWHQEASSAAGHSSYYRPSQESMSMTQFNYRFSF